MSDEQVDCMACGEPIEECDCGGCQVCGRPDCEHLQYRAEVMLAALGAAIEAEKAKREAEKEKP